MAEKPEEKNVDRSSLPRSANSVKGLLVGRNIRLSSIKGPRDLTLGTAPKRTFVPNIPPRRDKKQEASSSSVEKATTEPTKLVQKTVSPKKDSSLGRGRGKKNIIQTEGSVFAEGVAGTAVSRRERKEAYQKSDSAPSRRRGCPKKEEENLEGTHAVKQLDDFYRDDFIDDGDDDDEISELYKPVIFPETYHVDKKEPKSLDTTSNFNSEADKDGMVKFMKKEGMKIKEEPMEIKSEPIKVKEEPMEVKEETQPVVSTDTLQEDILHLLKQDKQMLLLEFPEVFSLCPKVDDLVLDSNQSQTFNQKTSESKKPSSSSISSLPEGHIGKLQILKSGKTRLVVGNLTHELLTVSPLRKRHEVVSITTDSGSGDLAVLGYIGHKLIFAPDMDAIISHA